MTGVTGLRVWVTFLTSRPKQKRPSCRDRDQPPRAPTPKQYQVVMETTWARPTQRALTDGSWTVRVSSERCTRLPVILHLEPDGPPSPQEMVRSPSMTRAFPVGTHASPPRLRAAALRGR